VSRDKVWKLFQLDVSIFYGNAIASVVSAFLCQGRNNLDLHFIGHLIVKENQANQLFTEVPQVTSHWLHWLLVLFNFH